MVCKLTFAALILGYGIWLVTAPARTAGMKPWRDCFTAKGLICIPKPGSSHERSALSST